MHQIPVAVVRAVVPDREGRILLLRRRAGSAGAGQWCLPGGKVDYGVTVVQALRNEIAEETGLRCRGAEFLFYQDSLPLTPGGMHCINFYFRCDATGEVTLNNESIDYAWAAPDQLSEFDIAFRNDEGIRRYLAGPAAVYLGSRQCPRENDSRNTGPQ